MCVRVGRLKTRFSSKSSIGFFSWYWISNSKLCCSWWGIWHARWMLVHTTLQYCMYVHTTLQYCTYVCTTLQYCTYIHTTLQCCTYVHTTLQYCTYAHTTLQCCTYVHTTLQCRTYHPHFIIHYVLFVSLNEVLGEVFLLPPLFLLLEGHDPAPPILEVLLLSLLGKVIGHQLSLSFSLQFLLKWQ